MIEILITPDMKTRAFQFAKEKVESGTAFPRTESGYTPVGDAELQHLGLDGSIVEWLKSLDKKKRNQVVHWFIGKIGEVAGQESLELRDINHECPDKWKVVADPHYGDLTDALIYPGTTKQAKVNFRTGWLPNHRLIIAPPDMKPSDYYIGIKLDLKQSKAFVYGYTTRSEMEWNESIPRPAYTIPYTNLHDLKGLKDF